MLTILTIGFVVVFVVMSLFWLLQVQTKNASWVDVAWTINLAILAWIYFFLGHGYFLRRAIIVTLVSLWALRLTSLLLGRLKRDGKEDVRYQRIRERWKTNLNVKFFFFFEFQALIDVILSIPFLLICLNPTPQLSAIEIFGIAIWIIGLLGETVADEQLKRFKRNPQNKGKVCQDGLWNYSRHPNYFFEWLMWVGYFFFALGSPLGWISIICPAIMLHFLLNVSGVPLAEEQSLRSKGDQYRAYQRSTSVFVPLPKRK